VRCSHSRLIPRGLVWSWVFIVLSVGCTSTTSRPTASVSDVYFTNAESGPGTQRYATGNIRQILPEVRVFDRARGGKVKLVIVFADGYAHEMYLALITASGNRRTATWSVSSKPDFYQWRTSIYQWPLNANWIAGRYEVELTVDGVSAGTYAFDVK